MKMFEIIAAIWQGISLTHAPEPKPRSRSINTAGPYNWFMANGLPHAQNLQNEPRGRSGS